MVTLNHRLKATTLIESMIAMVIIVASMGIATLTYLNVMRSDEQRLQLKANQLLNQEAFQLKKDKNFVDEEKQMDGWTIKKTVEKYKETENLYQLTLSITNEKGKEIFKRMELILLE